MALLFKVRSLRRSVLLLLATLLTLQLYYASYLFRGERYFKVDYHLLETMPFRNIDLGEGLPAVRRKRLVSEEFGKVRIYLLHTRSCWTFEGDLANTLLLRRLATRLRHSRRPYLVIAHMNPQPASRRYNRLARLRPGIITASQDGPIMRAIKVLSLQPRWLIFTSRSGLLSDPRVREALQSSAQIEASKQELLAS